MSEPGRAQPTLQIDNERVRVTQWRFAPGASTGWHRHALDYVVVPLTSGTLRLDEPGGVRDVTLKAGEGSSEALRKELVAWVRKEIGAIAQPDVIQWAPSLPKTRSGKIMRRILRKIAANDFKELGDTSTLADPAVVDDLIKNRAAT